MKSLESFLPPKEDDADGKLAFVEKAKATRISNLGFAINLPTSYLISVTYAREINFKVESIG